MRGVLLLRLLVLFGFISVASGIAMVGFETQAPDEQDEGFDDEVTDFAEPESATPLDADDGAAAPSDSEDGERASNTPGILIGVGGGLLTSVILGTVFFEFIRILFILAFLTPLVVRKKEENERTKGRILGFIEGNAGVHFSALRDGLGLANGVTAYHLQILEREGSVMSWRDGKLRRYAASSINPNDIDQIKSPLVGTRLAILQVLSQSGALGLSGKEIRSQLEISRQLLSHHLRVLSSNGFIEKAGSSRKAPWKISHDGVQALQFVV